MSMRDRLAKGLKDAGLEYLSFGQFEVVLGALEDHPAHEAYERGYVDADEPTFTTELIKAAMDFAGDWEQPELPPIMNPEPTTEKKPRTRKYGKAARQGYKWTDDDEEFLKMMMSYNASVQEIADMLLRTPAGIHRHMVVKGYVEDYKGSK